MRNKPFEYYSPIHLGKLRRVLADIYTAFGDVSENLYLVGGLVPDLLVKNKLSYLREYLGTLDIDLAIKFAVSEKGKYRNLYNILRSIGFEKQKTDDGRDVMNHSFIKYGSGYKPIVLDLITDDKFKPAADKLKEIAPNVDAVKFRGVYLVFKDFITVDLGMAGTKKSVRIKIPNIIPFLTLKAFAYSDEENRAAKDAYDIWYTIVNFKDGPVSVKEEISKYKGNKETADALKVIRRDFDNETSSGTKDVVNILVTRYGLDRALAFKEVMYPIRSLKG
jgi:hypothetical protein